MPSAASPKSLGFSADDKRVLGVGLQTAVFELVPNPATLQKSKAWLAYLGH
jgi:hypothetical protein